MLTDGAVLAMPEIGAELPLAEAYAGIEFAADDPSPGDAWRAVRARMGGVDPSPAIQAIICRTTGRHRCRPR